MSGETILQVRGLTKHFPGEQGLLSAAAPPVRAVDGVELDVMRGETLAVVGESGSGKTTTARAILRLIEPTSGSVLLHDGKRSSDVLTASGAELKSVRRRMQMVFQDPYSFLNPRMTVGRIVAEPLEVHAVGTKEERRARAAGALEAVGLKPGYANRYPHAFSGGQRQRIAIARAIVLNPSIVVADEPVSALDVSVQAQVLTLLQDIQEQLGLTYIVIAHDLAVVRHIATRVAVMYLGKIVEIADTDPLFERPLHPYTEALISAVPVPDPNAPDGRIVLSGDIPSPANPPRGCRFHTRCPYVQDRCRIEMPQLREVAPGRTAACHFAGELPLSGVKAYHAG